MNILWTPKAKSGLEQTFVYLEENWNSRELSRFREKLYSVLKLIREQPELFPKSEIYSGSRKALIDKYNFIIYRMNTEKVLIEILLFRGTRQKGILE